MLAALLLALGRSPGLVTLQQISTFHTEEDFAVLENPALVGCH